MELTEQANSEIQGGWREWDPNLQTLEAEARYFSLEAK